jgi:hypothetical protein
VQATKLAANNENCPEKQHGAVYYTNSLWLHHLQLSVKTQRQQIIQMPKVVSQNCQYHFHKTS